MTATDRFRGPTKSAGVLELTPSSPAMDTTLAATPAAEGEAGRTTGSHQEFRADLQGLRAVAVALVVLYHAHLPGIRGGYVGVDVFYVLSGFLITGLLLRERETSNRTSLVGFYARRARRILPAAFVVIVATVLASYIWLGFVAGNRTADDARWASVFLANIHFGAIGTTYLGSQLPPSPIQQLWSLSVEEQFYVVWPTLLLITAYIGRRFSLRARLAAVLSVIVVASYVWSIVETNQNGTWAYFSPLTRAWELAIGGLVAVGTPQLAKLGRRTSATLSWAGLAAIIFSALWFTEATTFPGSLVAVPVLGAVLFIVAGCSATPSGAAALLRNRPVQWIGAISYSLYLWHWPILTIAYERVGHQLSLADNLGLVAVSVVFAAASFYLVENPIRFRKFFTRHPVRSVAFGVALIAASFAFCTWEIHDHATHTQFVPTAIAPLESSATSIPTN
ncbi:MAG TPA: acyltransferase [Acidimicrobiales bacterium]